VWQVVRVDAYDWGTWRAARPGRAVLHLDTASAGRSSLATLAAMARHARLEAETGGYVAEEDARASLETLRHQLAGLMGTDADGLAFVESATAALVALVRAWPLAPGATVGVAPSEWGPNLEILEHHGLKTTPLEVDGAGVLDLDVLETRLRLDPPAVLLVDEVAAHRGLLQPTAEVVALGRAYGVPVWVDAAQAVGHVPLAGGDAVLATSRKWLTGPRGVGMLAVASPYRDDLHVLRPAKHPGWPTVHHFESGEAHVAGRVGLAAAVREYVEAGPELVTDRLAEVGRLTREAVATVSGWAVAHPEAPAGATTSLVATAGQDVERSRAGLLDEHAILTTACLPWRAPLEMTPGGPDAAPLLRLSPHVDLTDEDLERLCRALPQT
jgi:pyridoxal 5-phosphate dependent beta-lyase